MSTPSAGPFLRADPSERAVCLFVASACLAVLIIAAWLTPSAEGHGTHTQLPLLPCVWVQSFGRPCPTCGMTTSFAHAAEGQFIRAFLAQPFGALLAVVTAMVFWLSLHSAVLGSRVARLASSLVGGRLLWLGGFALLAAWIYKLAIW